MWLCFFLSTLSPVASFVALKDEWQRGIVEGMWFLKSGETSFPIPALACASCKFLGKFLHLLRQFLYLEHMNNGAYVRRLP